MSERLRGQSCEEAERLRKRAATITNDDQLRDGDLGLAREYERLADILEERPPLRSPFR
jgi:hypothetical protein